MPAFLFAATLLLSAAGTYEKNLAAVEKRAATVEELFRSATAFRDAVHHDRAAEFEALPEAAFAGLGTRLRGIILNRDEVIIAEPDARFFLNLAARFGHKADIAFFEEYARTRPDGVWPSYVQMQTDVTGCTDFASGQLVDRYAGWRRYRRGFPQRYQEEVTRQLEAIEAQINDGTCVCGDRDSFIRELRRFDKAFPNVIRRKRDTAGIRFHCQSG